jgi:glycosyltransferase involved in cell wall biosynthesis
MRVVMYAVDGTGLGHIARLGQLARRLIATVPHVEVLFCTNAADLRAAESFAAGGDALRILRLPYTQLDEASAADDPTPRRVNAEAFLSAARAFEPHVAVFDTHVPQPILASRILEACARLWILRSVETEAAVRWVDAGIARAFDRIIVPEDFGAAPLPNSLRAGPLAARVCRVGAMLRPPPSRHEIAEAKASYGLAEDAPYLVATFGGGGPQLAPGKRSTWADASDFAAATLSALERISARTSLRTFLQWGPHAPPSPASTRVNVVRFDPKFPALCAGASAAIALASYNTAWELVRARVPTLWLTKRARHESQRARADAIARTGGAIGVLGVADAHAIEDAVSGASREPARLDHLRSVLAGVPVTDGIDECVRIVAAVSRDAVYELRAPPPCEDPCDGCPVPRVPLEPVAAEKAEAAVDAAPIDALQAELEGVASRGTRRVRFACSFGRDAPALELGSEAARALGLVPLLDTTGRMASAAPGVGPLVAKGIATRLLLFGAGKKLHQRASRAGASFGVTRGLAASVPADAAPPSWVCCTTRFGASRIDEVTALDRRAHFRPEGKREAERLPAVVVLRKRWLPQSEAFIYAQVRALSRYRPIAVCRDTHGERPRGLPLVTLGDTPPDRAAPLLRAYGARIAHAEFLSCAATFARLARALEVPLVVSVRGHDLYRRRDDSPSRFDEVFREAAVLFARTPSMARDLVEAGADAERVHVLPTGVDLERFAFRPPPEVEDEVRVVAVCRFTAKKGVPDLLRAFAKLAEREPRATLAVYGRGHVDEDPSIVAGAEAALRRAPLEGRVRLLPAIPQAALAGALSSSHLFLCASRTAPDGDREGLPNAVKEAMAVGLPVVSTDHGELGELIAPRGAAPAGRVVPEGDADALGAALCEVASAPENWRGMTDAGRARIEASFDLRSVVAELEEIYDRLIASPRL